MDRNLQLGKACRLTRSSEALTQQAGLHANQCNKMLPVDM